LLPFYFFMLP